MVFDAGTATTITLATGQTIDVTDSAVWVSRTASGWRGVPHLLTAAQVAVALGCKEWKVGQLVRDGELPYILVGSVRRWHPDDVAAYIAANRRRGT